MSLATLTPLIAGESAPLPAERRGLRRDEVRLLVTDRKGRTHEHATFEELPRFLGTGDLLVVNDSATLAAALHGRRADGSPLAVHFSGEIATGLWIVEPRSASGRGPERTIVAGDRLELPQRGTLTFLWPLDAVRPRLWYAHAKTPFGMRGYLAQHGEPIRYRYVTERLPLGDYQTLFARVPGSAEMPSAARPFTDRVVRAVRNAGARFATITLHCGVASTEEFENPAPERFSVPSKTAEQVNAARAAGGRTIAVGTTVVRALESALEERRVVATNGWTELVIGRNHPVRTVDGLLTGFHEPAASHIALLREFLDDALLAEAYELARERGYLWHEFGDVHLVL